MAKNGKDLWGIWPNSSNPKLGVTIRLGFIRRKHAKSAMQFGQCFGGCTGSERLSCLQMLVAEPLKALGMSRSAFAKRLEVGELNHGPTRSEVEIL